MTPNRFNQATAILALCLVANAVNAAAVGTAITYQGELSDGGAAVTDLCDFQFALWDDPSAGSPVGGIVAQTIDVDNGSFTTLLDFGAGIFTGDARWLQIDVCCPSPCSPALTPLDPRQELTPAPYALHAVNAPDGHSLDASDGTPEDVLVVNAEGNIGVGTITPVRKFHFSTHNLGVGPGDLLSADEFLIEQDDARITLLSSPTGLSGSSLYLREMSGGAVTDEWRLRRLTSPNGSDFVISHAVALGSNFNAMTLKTDGGLTAAGQIESLTGGFKFPDGTTQTTAATGGGNTLDAAYDEGGAGAGRTITADTGPVEIAGTDGLTVAGVIESTSGGVKFPDGTTQTTAATGGGGDGHSLDAADGDPIDALFVDNTGRVGIGTTTPSAKLDVQGSLKAGSVTVSTLSADSIEVQGAQIQAGPPLDTALIAALRWDLLSKSEYAVRDEPVAMAFDGAKIWVANRSDDFIYVLQASDGSFLHQARDNQCDQPSGIAYTKWGMWVVCSGSDRLTLFDLADASVLHQVSGGSDMLGGIAYDSDSDHIWVSDAGGDDILKLDARNGAMIDSFSPPCNNPNPVAFDGARIWVGCEQVIRAIQPSDGMPAQCGISGEPTGDCVYNINNDATAIAIDGTYIWTAANRGASMAELVRIDPQVNPDLFPNAGIFLEQHLGNYTAGLAYDGNHLWLPGDLEVMPGQFERRLFRIAASSGSIVETFSVGTTPKGVVFDGVNLWVANSGDDSVMRKHVR